MGYNQENYVRIRREYENKYRLARADAERRRAEALEAIPDLRLIEQELGKTGLTLMRIAMEGEDLEQGLEKARQRNAVLQEHKRLLLESHGYPADYTEVRYECPLCMDEGFVDCKMCSCMKEKLILAAYESSGMLDLLKTQSFENFDLSYYQSKPELHRHMAGVLASLKQYAEGFVPGESENLLLQGGTGLGKTHLSTSVAATVIRKGFDVFYAPAIGMMSDFEVQRFGNSGGGETGAGTSPYFDSDLLILDDLGTEVVNQFTLSTLYNVINTRINRRKCTIINTNLTFDEIRAKYADRVTSRIFGEFRPLTFYGVDIRAQKLARKA